MVYIAVYGHLQRTCQRLEDALYLVMLVFALSLDVQVHLGSVAQALKEVEEHLCGQLANFFTMELSIPYQPGTASKVEGHLAEAVVHGQGVAITLYAPLVAKGPGYTLTYG